MDLCKNYGRHLLSTTLEMINFWCRPHSRWPTFSHFSFKSQGVSCAEISRFRSFRQ